MFSCYLISLSPDGVSPSQHINHTVSVHCMCFLLDVVTIHSLVLLHYTSMQLEPSQGITDHKTQAQTGSMTSVCYNDTSIDMLNRL